MLTYFQAIGCCVVLMSFAILGQRVKKQSATRAREVILASATFDTEGRLMVNPDGLLPCEKITNSYLEDVSSMFLLNRVFAKILDFRRSMKLSASVTLSSVGCFALHIAGRR